MVFIDATANQSATLHDEWVVRRLELQHEVCLALTGIARRGRPDRSDGQPSFRCLISAVLHARVGESLSRHTQNTRASASGDHETAGTTVMAGKGAEPLNERTDKRTNEITDNELME